MQEHPDQTPYDWHDEEGAAAAYVVNGGLAFQGRGKLWAINATLTAAGSAVDVYDGVNAQGRLIWSHRDPAGFAQPADYSPHKAVRIDLGVFVVAAAAIVTITYEPRAPGRKELK